MFTLISTNKSDILKNKGKWYIMREYVVENNVMDTMMNRNMISMQ